MHRLKVLFCAIVGTVALGVSTASSREKVVSAVLADDQTSSDGSLTLLIDRIVGAQRVSLRNNLNRPIGVDSFTLEYHLGSNCNGQHILLAANTTTLLCTLDNQYDSPAAGSSRGATPTPIPQSGYASLEMSVTWHVIPPPVKPKETHLPTATPSPSARPQV